MKTLFFILTLFLFSCSKKEKTNSSFQKAVIENKDLNSNFRKIIINYQNTYPIKSPRKGNIYMHSVLFLRQGKDTIFRVTRGANGIPNFVAKDNYAFGIYSDEELKDFFVMDSFKLSSKLISNYKRNFPDSIISDGKEPFVESITPLATYKLENGIPKHVKTDTIWNHWD